MILRKKSLLTTITILSVFLLTAFSHSKGKEHNSAEEESNSGSDRRYLLIINSSLLSCPLCLTSFTKFIEVVNVSGIEKSFIGVLTIEREPNESISEKNVRIIEKQLRGFISGNNIGFPFILDRDGVFNDLSLDDITMISFDVQKKTIKKYKFPLTKGQLGKIFEKKEKLIIANGYY